MEFHAHAATHHLVGVSREAEDLTHTRTVAVLTRFVCIAPALAVANLCLDPLFMCAAT